LFYVLEEANMKRLLLWCLGFLLVAGCIQFSQRLARIDMGMSYDEVIAALGKPDRVKTTSHQVILEYKNKSAESSDPAPQSYWIYLRGGRVTEHGERSPQSIYDFMGFE